MNSPKQLRENIQSLTSHLEQVREMLEQRSNIEIAHIGKECKRTADHITELLKAQQLPEDYKVAVVGRFKTGKSSFVNELLGAKLASEDTNPETAAITSFRHGKQVKATIKFLPQQEWSGLKNLYSEDPKHPDAHRVKLWNGFAKPKKQKDDKPAVVYDIQALESQYIKTESHTIEICLNDTGKKSDEKDFRNKLKEFTSGAKPLHCIVQSIEITSPANILEEGVLLIDTPGLDDTERFRVSLTEKAVEGIDAVLFLTKSGSSYGQSEKDFLLSLLRKGTVKQLILVVTQVDQTYEQHRKAAKADEEEPQSLATRIEQERKRISDEVLATLAELSETDTPAIQLYKEQLGKIQIEFTSAHIHRDWKAKEPLTCSIDINDPGGVVGLTNQLFKMLSTESRLVLASQNISNGASNYLLDLQKVLEAKLTAINEIKDQEVAEQKLNTFRSQFETVSDRFEGDARQQVNLLIERLKKNQQQVIFIENICLRAEKQIASFELNDIGRHWRTRRSGYWGYMRDFEERVANYIFPKVQELLAEYIQGFEIFVSAFEVAINKLSKEGTRISNELEIGSTMPFDVSSRLKISLERSLQKAQELISSEELRITSLLDNFISREVEERITQCRVKVSDIWGEGTTVTQSKEVSSFYKEVKELLSAALKEHLELRTKEFSDFLVLEALNAPEDALNAVKLLLEQAADNIVAATTALLADQKENAQTQVNEIMQVCEKPLAYAATMQPQAFDDVELQKLATVTAGSVPSQIQPEQAKPISVLPSSLKASLAIESSATLATPLLPSAPVVADVMPTNNTEFSHNGNDWINQIQNNAVIMIDRIRMNDGSTDWPWSKLFETKFIKGANKMTLIDPYLSSHHQHRNLTEFLLHLAETAHPKTIEIVTRLDSAEAIHQQKVNFAKIAQEIFSDYGVILTWRHETNLHDRYLILDHGVLFKLGRGLDIYKPATGLSAMRPNMRKVRQTEIDIFAIPNHVLTEKNLN